MIDVRFVVGHGLWILGAAVVLSAFSYYDWVAKQQGLALREVLGRCRGWKISRASGLLFGASGFLLLAGTPGWARVLWLVVWAAASFDLWRLKTKA